MQRQRPLILIVEDEAIIAMDVEARLKKLFYDVAGVASSGEEAVRKADELQPDLILMDIVLKYGMTGIEAAQKIREKHDIPIVYLTAYSDYHTLQLAKVTEPYGFILKPFEDRELETILEISLYKHRTEKQIRRTEHWLSTVLHNIGDAVITTDVKGFITYMNPVAESLTGWKTENALGKDLLDVFHIVNEFTHELAENPVERVLREGIITTLVNHTILITKDGRQIPIDDSAAPIKDEHDKISGVVLTFREIFGRIEVEKKIREQGVKMRVIAELSDKINKSFQDFSSVLDAITRSIVDLLGDGCVIRLLSEDKQWFVPAAVQHRTAEGTEMLQGLFAAASQRVTEGMSGKVMRTGEAVFLPVVPQEEIRASVIPAYQSYLDRYGIHSLIVVPLKSRNRIIGTIAISRDKPGNPYTEDEKIFAETLADRAVIAVDNAQLFRELKQSEHFHRLLYERNLAGVFITNMKGDVMDCNEAFARILGYESREEALHHKASEFYFDMDERKLFVAKLRTEKTLTNMETRLRRKDGKSVWVIENVNLIERGGSEEDYFEGTLIDISEQKNAQEDLLRERNKAQQYLDIAGVIFLVIDENQKVLLINKRGCELLGYEEKEIIGKNWFDTFIPQNARENIRPRFMKIIRGDDSASLYYENPVLTKSGEERIIAWQQTELRDETGKIIGTLSSGTDITERKRAEKIKDVSYKIAAFAGQQMNLETLFECIHKELSALIDVKNFYIALYDADKEMIFFPYYVDEHYPDRRAVKPRKLSKGLTEYVIKKGKPLFAYDSTMKDLVDSGDIVMFGSPSLVWMGAPLRTEDKITGVIGVQSYDNRNTYTPKDLEILEFVSGQIATTIERHRTEQTLRETEERLYTVVVHSPVILFSIDKNGIFTLSEGKGLNALGMKPGQVVGLSVYDVYKNNPQILANIRRALAGEEFTDYVDIQLSPDKTLTFETRYTPLRDSEGTIEGLIGIATDVTESLQATRYREEIRVAKNVHKKLLPKKLPEIENIEFSAYSIGWEEVGGDYYDYLVNSGKLFLAIGDISGKGTWAAFHAAQMKGIFHAQALQNTTPEKFIRYANTALSVGMDKSTFMTLTYAVIDPKKRTITRARAGHCPELFYNHKKKKAEYLQLEGLGLGIIRNPKIFNTHVHSKTISYQAKDVIVFYSDGLTDARNKTGEEYGYERLIKVVEKYAEQGVRELQQNILIDLLEHTAGVEQDDDITMMILRLL